MLRHSALAAILILGLVGCGGRTPANGGDGGTTADGPYLLDDAGHIIYDDAGNPIPVQQDAAPGQHDGPLVQNDAPVAQQDSGSTPGIIQCGQTTCESATQQCCISGGGGGGTATCIDIGTQCQGATIACDGPEDCSGTTPICCGSLGGGGGSRGVTCTDTCQGVRLCRLDTDCDTGDKCCGSGRVGAINATFCEAEANCPNTNPTTGVPCGTATCNSPDVCCVTMQGSSCTADCQQGLSLACDGPEDCSGGTPVCCADVSMGGGGSQCVADGDCNSGGYTSGVVCHTVADCQSGENCNAIPMTSIQICR